MTTYTIIAVLGYLLCFIIILLAIGIVTPLYIGLFRGAPYVPSNDTKTKRMFEFAKISSHDTVYDLGSGDGRLLIAAIHAGAKKAVGFEINPWLAWWSRYKVKQAGLSKSITIYNKSFWTQPVSEATLVFLYLLPSSMKKLEPKLKNELQPGTRIVANAFVFPEWKPVKEEGEVRLYVKSD